MVLQRNKNYNTLTFFATYRTLVLTIIRATHAVSFIHSSLVNPQGLLSITMLFAHD